MEVISKMPSNPGGLPMNKGTVCQICDSVISFVRHEKFITPVNSQSKWFIDKIAYSVNLNALF